MPRGKTKKPSRQRDRQHHRPARKPTLDDIRGAKPRPLDIPITSKTGRRQSRIGFRDQGTPAAQIEARKREAAAVELRILGASFQEIADELGYSGKGGAHDAYSRGYKALVAEIQSEASQAVRDQLLRNKAYRKRVLQAGNSGDGSAAIAAVSVALKVDALDMSLRGVRPGDGANLDAVPAIAGPAGNAGAAVCAKCGAAATVSLTDPKFEMERIETINKILIESGAAFVPLKVTDDEGWEQSASTAPAKNAPQTVTPQVPQVAGARVERIKDRELHDLANYGFSDNEIL